MGPAKSNSPLHLATAVQALLACHKLRDALANGASRFPPGGVAWELARAAAHIWGPDTPAAFNPTVRSGMPSSWSDRGTHYHTTY